MATIEQLGRPPAPFMSWDDVPEDFEPRGVTTERLVSLSAAAANNPDAELMLTDLGFQNLLRTVEKAHAQKAKDTNSSPSPTFDSESTLPGVLGLSGTSLPGGVPFLVAGVALVVIAGIAIVLWRKK